MDISKLFESLFQGNNWILILLAVFLFKDQIFAWLTPKPSPPAPTPTPAPVPAPVPVPVPVDDRPIVDAILKILPTILPVVLPMITKAIKENEPKSGEK